MSETAGAPPDPHPGIEVIEVDIDKIHSAQALVSLAPAERAQIALQSSKTEAALVALAAKNAGITEIKDKAGREQAHGAAMELMRTRTTIADLSKKARDDATKFSKAVIAEETRLIGIIEPEEKRLKALRDGWDEEQERIKREKAEAERKRLLAIGEQITAIKNYANLASQCRTSARIQELIDRLTAVEVTPEIYAEFTDDAAAAKSVTLNQMGAALKAKQDAEIEAQRLADERAEQERVRQEQETMTTQHDERAELIKHMVNRFLAWKLPQNFHPDSFISFDREKHDTWGGYPNSWPTGTSLLTAEQAKQMLEYLMDGYKPAVKPARELVKVLDAPGCERIKDFYSVGPVQRAAVESFAAALMAADAQAGEPEWRVAYEQGHADGYALAEKDAQAVAQGWKQTCSEIEDAIASGRMTAAQVFTKMRAMLSASPAAPAAAQVAQPEPDMRAICEKLGFDPTNHHNAAKCPYCRPPEAAQVAQPLTPETIRLASVALRECPANPNQDWQEAAIRVCRDVAAHGIGKDQARVGINGLTEAGTAASASVMGIVNRPKGAESCCEHASDCAVHNAPAYPPGPCDCGADQCRVNPQYSGPRQCSRGTVGCTKQHNDA